MNVLDLSGNHITQIPSSPSQLLSLSKLNSLYLNQNRLTSLPDAIENLTNLECLSLSYNFLPALPHGLAFMHRLRELRLSNNRLTTFPSIVSVLALLLQTSYTYFEKLALIVQKPFLEVRLNLL